LFGSIALCYNPNSTADINEKKPKENKHIKKKYYLFLSAFGIITCNQEAPFTTLYYTEKNVANISLTITFLFILKIIFILMISQFIDLNEELFNILDIVCIASAGFPFSILGNEVMKKIPEEKHKNIINSYIKLIVVLTLLSLIIKLIKDIYI